MTSCLCKRMSVILRLLVLNFFSSGKISTFVPVPELLTDDLIRRRRTFLALDHWRNCVQWATDKLRWNLRTWRRIYWSDESRFLWRFTDGRARGWRRHGRYPFQDNVVAEIEVFGGGSVMVWSCFSHDHKLDIFVVRQTSKGQRYIHDILQPIVYPHFRAHQAARPIFQDDIARPHRARVITDSLAQEGIEKLQWPSRSPDINPI